MNATQCEEDKKLKMDKAKKKEIIWTLQKMDIEDIQCGIGSCTPSWLQVFARTSVYLIVYCVSGLMLGMFFTYTVSIISTLEKRFKLTSKQTGFAMAGNDISQVMFAIIVAYFGNYGNRPKWLGIGIISASVACFLSAVPHFLYGPGQDAVDMATSLSAMSSTDASSGISNRSDTNKNDLCHSPYVEECNKRNGIFDNSSIGALIFLFFGEFFVGLTICTFYSLGFVYLDDNINKEEFPLYYALSMIIRVIGPVAGFFLGSKCLAYYIDPRYAPNISLNDPRWLGAWWLGYLFLGASLLVFGSIVLLFPRTLPSTLFKKIRKAHKEKLGVAAPLTKDSDLGELLKLVKTKQHFTKPSLRELPVALRSLFHNKIWVANNFNTVFALLGIMGYWNFKPKYLEYQFRKSASIANFYTGVTSLIASILGLSISGLLIKVFRPGPRIIAAYNCFLTLFGAISMFSLAFLGCPQLKIVGSHSNSSPVASCTEGCGCLDRYSPVCSSDKLITFYSPCYAGCTAINNSVTPVEYLNCKCLSTLALNGVPALDETPNLYEIAGESPLMSEAKTFQGYCPETCGNFLHYIISLAVIKTFESTGRVGSMLIYLRSVQEHEKGLALGVSIVIYSLFAFIPAPIIMGAIIDSSCIIWDNTCGQRGNCWLYDSDKFRLIIHVVPGALILVSLIGDIVVFMNSNHLVLYSEEEQDPDQDQEQKDLGHDQREMKHLNVKKS